MASTLPVSDQVETLPGIRLLSGSLPKPLRTTRGRGWDEVVVELYKFRQLDVVTQSPEHVVSVHLAGAVNLLQSRNGQQSVRTLREGDIIVTPAGEPKRWRHDEEVEVVLLRLTPAFVRQIAAAAGVSHPERIELLDNFGTRDLQLEDLARKLLTEFRVMGFATHLYVESLATELAIHLLRHYSTLGASPLDSSPPLSGHKLRRAVEYINEHLGEDLTLCRIAEALAISPYHFAHVFKQATGLAPHRYVVERRIERAKSLLRETELPITEIASQMGYSNQSHFSAMFHRFTGQTPRGYRDET